MNFVIRLLITALAVIISSYLLPGVEVDSFLTAVIIGVVLALLNVTLKPILIILTIPATILTMGLFILVINALIILIADAIVPGFYVDGFWWALAFSLILWVVNSVLKDIGGASKEKR
ncbi:MAG: phage holin family protein [Bacteroidetes bacterium]|nr:phage holin family protein [Bacteroidota bacterium]MDA1122045.1 phage holin family protein [Bacteroidota bacterium]